MANIKNPKFFIVDDDAYCRMRYHNHLVNLGYNDTMLFDNGKDCISKLDQRPDVIFLDYDMKPIDGLEVLRKVREFDPNIHILIISGIKDMELAVNAIMNGAFDYVVKGEKDLDNISSLLSKILTMREFYAKLREVDLIA